MSLPRSATILPFPARPAPPHALTGISSQSGTQPTGLPFATELGQRGRWCGIMYVARQLRLERFELRTVVAHVRAHIASAHFPPPVSSRLRHGQPLGGAAAVTPKSEWLRAEVDAWVEARAQATLSPDMLAARRALRAAQVDDAIGSRLAGHEGGAA